MLVQYGLNMEYRQAAILRETQLNLWDTFKLWVLYSQVQWNGPLNYVWKIISDERMQAEEIYSRENISYICNIMC